MDEIIADYVVIGSGPAGQKAAVQAAKLDKKVIIIEKDEVPGGVSLNTGTIPSKSLREAILDLTRFYQRSFYGQSKPPQLSINDLNFRLQKIQQEQRAHLLRQFEKNHIQLIHGTAHFIDDHTIIVGGQRIRGHFFLIATGSQPRNPRHVPFDDEKILDSSRLLSIDHLPKSLIVLGGGIIGSEYASFFAALGTSVTVIDRKPHLLPLLDSEIGLHLQKSLSEIGLKMEGNREVESIERQNGEVKITTRDQSVFTAEMVLYALGREANVMGLDIDKAGVKLNAKGYIPVNAQFQTQQEHIYAAGDVIGPPALSSTSMEQGRLAARHAFGAEVHQFPTFFPIGIYTIPEISFCGYTEEQLKELGFHYEVGRAYYYEITRHHLVGGGPGMFKILFHKETLEILGVHIIGRSATEVIHIGQVAMSFKARIDYFVDQVFNYPTFAEGYRIAALNGMNKLKKKK